MTADQFEGYHEIPIEDGPPPKEERRKGYTNGRADGEAAKPSFLLPGEFPIPEPPRLIHNLMARGDELCAWGPPEAGKTFFMIDMACRFAAEGENWRGRAIEHGTCIYFAGERQASVRNRITAWAMRNGKLLTPQALPVLVLNRPLNLMRPRRGELQELVDEIQAVIEKHKLPPVIAKFCDTVHSLSPGSKEDAQSFGWMIGNARELRELVHEAAAKTAKAANLPAPPLPAVGYVHHCGKDEDLGPRGSNSLTGGMNLSARISVVQNKWRTIEADKNNDLQNRPVIEPFVIENVTVRHTAEGEPVRIGCHVACGMQEVVHLKGDAAKAKAKEMKAAGKSVRDIAQFVGHPRTTIHRWLKE